MADTDYTRGEQDATKHVETYGAVMRTAAWGSGVCITLASFPTMLLMGVGWGAALLLSIVFGVIIFNILKLFEE